MNTRDVLTYQQAAQWYEGRDPELKTKFGYAVRRMKPQVELILRDYQERLDDLRVEHCLTENEDGTGAIRRDEKGNYSFSREGMKKLNEAHRELLDAPVAVEPYFATQLPDDLPAAVYDAMEGFTIRLATIDTNTEAFTVRPNGGAELVEESAAS